jgi:hypothetical protein
MRGVGKFPVLESQAGKALNMPDRTFTDSRWNVCMFYATARLRIYWFSAFICLLDATS